MAADARIRTVVMTADARIGLKNPDLADAEIFSGEGERNWQGCFS
jgi:hypothetical protein